MLRIFEVKTWYLHMYASVHTYVHQLTFTLINFPSYNLHSYVCICMQIYCRYKYLIKLRMLKSEKSFIAFSLLMEVKFLKRYNIDYYTLACMQVITCCIVQKLCMTNYSKIVIAAILNLLRCSCK